MISGTGKSGRWLILGVPLSLIVLLPVFIILLSLGKVAVSPCATSTGLAVTDVSVLYQALLVYVADESELPARDLAPDPARNDFPLLYDALFGERKPRGNGGRNAPYAEFKEDRVVVQDTEGYRKATPAEIRDPRVKKYLVDPWGNPYVYRAGEKLSEAKIYSLGPNEADDTVTLSAESDDIVGSW